MCIYARDKTISYFSVALGGCISARGCKRTIDIAVGRARGRQRTPGGGRGLGGRGARPRVKQFLFREISHEFLLRAANYVIKFNYNSPGCEPVIRIPRTYYIISSSALSRRCESSPATPTSATTKYAYFQFTAKKKKKTNEVNN